MRTAILLVIICLILFPTAAGELWSAEGRRPLVAVSLPSDRERWARDLSAMRDYAQAKGVDLAVEVAKDNQMRQNFQVGKLLAQNPDVLILTSHDAAGAAFIVKKAQDQGVKVVCYDRLILNVPVELYISFDSEAVGEMQGRFLAGRAPQGPYILMSGAPNDYNSRLLLTGAMKVLEPLIKPGQITVAADGPVVDWVVAEAEAMVEAVLAKGVTPAAILAPNDLMAEGAIRVLEAHGLAGRVPVTGQDAEAAAARRILAGTQGMTAFKDTRLLGAKAMELAVKLAENQPLDGEINGRIFNGSLEVPSVFLTPVLVDRDNLGRVLVESGYLSPEEVYGRSRKGGPRVSWKRN